jgi:hypothetical protein
MASSSSSCIWAAHGSLDCQPSSTSAVAPSATGATGANFFPRQPPLLSRPDVRYRREAEYGLDTETKYDGVPPIESIDLGY